MKKKKKKINKWHAVCELIAISQASGIRVSNKPQNITFWIHTNKVYDII